eukprot:556016_1
MDLFIVILLLFFIDCQYCMYSTLIWHRSTAETQWLATKETAFIASNGSKLWILGGTHYSTDQISYDKSRSFRKYFIQYPFDYTGQVGQSSYQNNDILYMMQQNHVPWNITVYNITLQRPQSFITATNNVATDYNSQCLVYHKQYLLIMGGNHLNKTLTMYDIHNNQWLFGPNTAIAVAKASCNVVNDILYLIGGYDGMDVIYDIVQILNISNPANIITNWDILSETMTDKRSSHRSVVKNDMIYVVGGWNYTDYLSSVDVINTLNGRIYFDSNMLYPKSQHAIIWMNDVLYCFGGYPFNYDQYFQYAAISNGTSNFSTISPTNVPIEIPTFTTILPTHHPQTAPFYIPSISPTILSTTSTFNETYFDNDNSKRESKIITDLNSSLGSYIVIGLVLCAFGIVTIFGLFDAKRKRYIFNYSNVCWFVYHLLDFFTDIRFILLLFNDDYMALFTVAVCFMFVSSFISMFQMNKNIKIWLLDVDNVENNQWFAKYAGFLYLLCFILASTQSSIQLVTCNFLKIERFSLKLSEYYQMKLHNEHAITAILLENVPQLILEFIYLIKSKTLNDITLLAMIFSVASILMAPFLYLTRKQLILNQTTNKEQYVLLDEHCDDNL